MRKIISLLLVSILALTVVGCSKETTTQKTEEELKEELKAEIRAELEAEAKKKESEKAIKNQDSEETEDIKDNEEHKDIQQENETNLNEGLPEEQLYKYLIDMEYAIDLNKDGQLDKIIYANDYEDNIYIEINGNKYKLNDLNIYSKEISDKFGTIYAEITNDKFGIIDIDTSDNSVEFVLSNQDTPVEKYLYFYRYDGKDFLSLGAVVIGDPSAEKDKIIADGSGEFIVQQYSHIMEAGIYDKKYTVGKTGSIEVVPQKGIYTYKTPIISKVNEKIKAYKDQKTEASFVEIEPGEEMVIHGEIDNWLNIKWKDQELWINGEEVELFRGDFNFQFDGVRFES